MKKRIIAALLALAITAGFCAVLAAGTAGTSSDPLLTLSYISGTLKNDILSSAQTKIDTVLKPAVESANNELSSSGTGGYSFSRYYSQHRLKEGDAIQGKLGTSVTLLAGSAAVSFSSGTVIDISTAGTVTSGSALVSNHRYFVAEDTQASFKVTGDTAVLQFDGYYKLSYSDKTDYNQLADALKTMGLFKGDGTGYGSGYALERPATRIEGLIMFIRLLGEENAALSHTGAHRFNDVPNWASKYVSYAYDKGYTKGTGDATFGTTETLTAQHYITFLLRALGYTEGEDFTWVSAMDSAQSLGIMTSGEKKLFASEFNRSRVVYLSYFGLSSNLKGTGTTLLKKLTDSGAVSSSVASETMSSVSVPRL